MVFCCERQRANDGFCYFTMINFPFLDMTSCYDLIRLPFRANTFILSDLFDVYCINNDCSTEELKNCDTRLRF